MDFNPKTDEVRICQGNIFDETRKMLKDEDIKFENWAIEGKLQDRVEEAYLLHLKSFGVNIRRISKESGKKRYFQLFGWVSYDFPKRRKYVKSGFKAWNNKWEKLCLEEYQKRLKKREKEKEKKRKQYNSKKFN
ncbi:MAG: hypothetical protein GY870_03080 [archaeon]|nr:hypothetical protein [archaeon]